MKPITVLVPLLGLILITRWFSIENENHIPFFGVYGFVPMGIACLTKGFFNLSDLTFPKLERIKAPLNVLFYTTLTVFLVAHTALIIYPKEAHYFFLDILIKITT